MERGCVCMKETCARKCCPFGQGYEKTTKKCIDLPEKFEPPVWEGSTLRSEFNITKEFHFLFNKMNCSRELEELRIPIRARLLPFHLETNGKLYVEVTKGSSTIYGPDQYCIDNFVWDDNRTEISALICFKSDPAGENHYQVSSTCMLISCFFIVLTVAVYAWLPELRNLHGMVLMAHLLSFLVGFTFMATMQIKILRNDSEPETCTSFTFIIYFSLLSAFFWLNIMCYDIWFTFSGKRAIGGRPSSAGVRFLYYSIYAFGIPLLLTVLLVVLEFGVDNNISNLLPRIRLQGCFLFGNSKVLYFYVPILILCVANLVFFTLTAMKIAEIKKQTQVLNKKDKQRFLLYIKLFLVMGVNWILEVVSYFYPEADYIWKFTDAYNVLVGLIIFIIFVCKVKTLKMIRHRIKNCQRSNANIGEMKAISRIKLSHWRNGTGIRSSIDTIRTTIGQDSDTKSIRSDKLTDTLHS
ncbi:unnamed protein product [Arctia plantaginis]|uniref:G-protein coupled receptors family 2 profile 2 domain-containing protein n=1 Tax=Arctia plantaginis TaxID=874455 RepID=A0A8S1BR86_ARCPL|nr:unnamed protein product [Arctia plantaginis]